MIAHTTDVADDAYDSEGEEDRDQEDDEIFPGDVLPETPGGGGIKRHSLVVSFIPAKLIHHACVSAGDGRECIGNEGQRCKEQSDKGL